MALPNKNHADRYDQPSYRRYVLIMLTLVYAFNFIDRQWLVILLEIALKLR